MAGESERMLVIEGISPDVEGELESALIDFSNAGVTWAFRSGAPQFYASLEWIVPTAAVVWFLDKYFGAMLSEAGKNHYKLFSTGLRKIYDKTLGPAKNVTRVIADVSGSVRPERYFSGNLSFMYRAPDGWRVKLLFPLDITPEQYDQSCVQFSALLRQFHENPGDSPLTHEIDIQVTKLADMLPARLSSADMTSTMSLLMYWNVTSNSFYVVDPTASGRTASLVSWPLGVPR